jgi:hypothetical protein
MVSFSKRVVYLFLAGILVLLINQALVFMEFMPDFHPEGSGFNDDRLYVTKEVVNDELIKEGKLNNLYLQVVKLLNYQPILIKIFNLICWIGMIFQTEKILNWYNQKLPIWLPLIVLPTLVVIHKEFLFSFLMLYFYRLHIQKESNSGSVLMRILLFILIFNLRYWAVLPLLISSYKQIRIELGILTKRALDIVILMSIFLLVSYFVDFLQEKVFQRGVEMYNQGQNYGLTSNRDSLAFQYSGSFWYTLFQFIAHPVPSPTQLLYNSFLLIPLALLSLAKIDYRKLYTNYGWLFLLILVLSITVIGLQFGSNPRYKFFIAFLVALASILASNRARRLYNQVVPIFFTIYILFIFYARF